MEKEAGIDSDPTPNIGVADLSPTSKPARVRRVPKKKFEATGLLFDFSEPPQPTLPPAAGNPVTIYTDGACSPNPGFGGWAAMIVENAQKRHVKGGAAGTTNNRMELQAAIAGLRALAEPTRIKLFTDSTYVRNGITGWLSKWERRGWQTQDKTPVKNQDLWQELSNLNKRHTIEWCWVRGHNGDPLNEECDQLAQAEAERHKKMAASAPAPVQ